MSSLVYKHVAYPLKCQIDSYCREATFEVTHCDESKDGEWLVYTDDTICFPGGGGQPNDFGNIYNSDRSKKYLCKEIERTDSGELFHRIFASDGEIPFATGEKVDIIIDWKRRFDIMCQHVNI